MLKVEIPYKVCEINHGFVGGLCRGQELCGCREGREQLPQGLVILGI